MFHWFRWFHSSIAGMCHHESWGFFLLTEAEQIRWVAAAKRRSVDVDNRLWSFRTQPTIFHDAQPSAAIVFIFN